MVKPRIQEIADRVREELGEDASLIPEKKSADESIYDEYDSLYDLVKDVFGEEILEYIGDKVFAYEIEQQRALRENENYEAAIIRQAAFIETALQSNIQTEWEKNRKKNKFDKEISRAEERYLDYLRNNSTLYVANMLGIIDNQGEYDAYEELMSARNDLAHTWWVDIPGNKRSSYPRISKRIVDVLEEIRKDMTEN